MEGLHSMTMRVLAGVLESRTGQRLPASRSWRLETALRPVLKAQALASLEDLAARVAAEPRGALAVAVVDALLNNETSFYRDPQMFRGIAQTILPVLIERARAEGRPVRAWCLGCSTGQEAYSLAMSFLAREGAAREARLSILATDVSTTAIARARDGLYTEADVARGLSIDERMRWFLRAGETWRIAPALRGMIDFRVDNAFEDRAACGTYDLILCRNVLLYLSPERRRLLFGRIAAHSGPGAYLLLGAGETVIGQTDAFVVSPLHRGFYQRVRTADRPSSASAASAPLTSPSPSPPSSPTPPVSGAGAARRWQSPSSRLD